jgi:hypothetical protein
MDLYIHSPICLHVVMLNQLSTGTTLPLPLASFYIYNVTCWGLRVTKITDSSSVELS